MAGDIRPSSKAGPPVAMRRWGRSAISLEIEALTVDGGPASVHAPDLRERGRVSNAAYRVARRLGRRHTCRRYGEDICIYRLA
jgi:hypothetical protein